MTLSIRNPLKESLVAGKLGLAMIIKQATSGDIALAARTCGYDALSVDLEHSVIPEHAAAQICVTALHAGITPLVRVPGHEAHWATRVLDAGALGIIAPHVDTAEQARAIVAACRFAPHGERSVAASWPHFGYASPPAEEARTALNEATLVIAMLENPQAVARAAEIAAVPGVDILHIGSNDLADALGIPGKFDHPEIEKAFKTVTDACKAHGKWAGAGGLNSVPEFTKKVVGMGVRFITAGNEWSFMMAAARQRANLLREIPLKQSSTA